MNEDLRQVRKFTLIASILTIIFFASNIILIPICSYIAGNYWLLFGIVFSYLGSIDDIPNSRKLIVPLTLGVIIYWIVKGFYFFDFVTFFWFSFMFGKIIQTFIDSYKNLSKMIIDNKVSEMTDVILSGVKNKKNLDVD
jgi:hypothetical protein